MYATSCRAAKVCKVYLLKISLALVLIDCLHSSIPSLSHRRHDHSTAPRRAHQVSAARVKGLIYNKDGKFIYRPSRWNQAHIIVIDDRSPKSAAASAATRQGGQDESSPNRTFEQRPAASTFPLNPVIQAYGVAQQQQQQQQPQLYHPAAAAAAAAAQLASANSIRAFYTPAAPYPLVNINDLPASAAVQASGRVGISTLFQALPPAGGTPGSHQVHQQQPPQMIQPIQFVSPRASPPALDTFGGYMSPAPGFVSNDYAADSDPYQSATRAYDAINQAAASYFPMGSATRQRPAASYEQGPPSYVGGDGGSQIHEHPQHAMRSEPPDMVPYDELAPPALQPGGYSSNAMRNQASYMKPRRASGPGGGGGGPVQDLDDAEGDHVDYYERDRGSMAAYDRNGGSDHRQYVRPPAMHSVIDDGGPQERGGGRSVGGPADHYNDHHAGHSRLTSEIQTPIPGSIQSIKSQLRRNSSNSSSLGIGGSAPLGGVGPLSNKTKPKQSGSASGPGGGGGSLGGSRPKLLNPLTPSDQSQAPVESASREPKSMQYWKQYKDQFDFVK